MKPLTLTKAGAAARNDATRGKRAARKRARKVKRMRAAIAEQFRAAVHPRKVKLAKGARPPAGHSSDWRPVATVAPRGAARDSRDLLNDTGMPPRVRFERPPHPLKRKCKRWSTR